jgi:hypothetical protein
MAAERSKGQRRGTAKAGERRRDERRAGGPRMHGRPWHDDVAPRDMTSDEPTDTMPDVVVPSETEGMRRAPSQRNKSGASRK